MKNTPTTTVTDKFSRIALKYAGRIILHHYGEGFGRSLAFTPLEHPIDSPVRCECGHSIWNATNFGNTIHFCPNKTYTFEVTEFDARHIHQHLSRPLP